VLCKDLRVLILYLYCLFFVLFAFFVIAGNSYSLISNIIIVVEIVIILIFTIFSMTSNNIITQYIILKLTTAYIIPQIAFGVLSDQNIWFRDMSYVFNQEELDLANVNILLTIIAIVIVQVNFKDIYSGKHVDNRFNLNITSGVIISILLLSLFTYYFYGVGRYTGENLSLPIKAINILYSVPESLIYLYFVMCYSLRSADKVWRKYMFYTTVFVFIFVVTLVGSKGGIYYVLMAYIYASLSLYGKCTISMKYSIKVLPFALLLIILGFTAGHYIKWVTRTYSLESGSARIKISELLDNINNKLNSRSPGDDFYEVPIRRMSLFEQAVVTTNSDLVNDSLTLINLIKSISDRVLPGNVYNILPTERLYAITARNRTFHEQRYTIMENSQWSLYGLLRAYFGVYNVFVLMFMFWVFNVILSKIYKTGKYRNIILLVSLLLLEHCFNGFGFDATIAFGFPLIIQFAAVLCIVGFISRHKRGSKKYFISS
jgi:hypothetical protein